jgi:hypothetical protein
MLRVHPDGGAAQGQIFGVRCSEGRGEDLSSGDNASSALQENQHIPISIAGGCYKIGAMQGKNSYLLISLIYYYSNIIYDILINQVNFIYSLELK